MDARHIAELTAAFYEAALAPEKWSACLKRMAEDFSSKAAQIIVFEPANANKIVLSVDHGCDQRWLELLHTTYAALCPIGPIMLLAEVDKPTTIFYYIDEDEYQESRFYREWCAPQDIYEMAGAVIIRRGNQIGAMSLYRSKDQPKFTEEEFEAVGILAPHIRRAVDLSGMLGHRPIPASGMGGVMDQLPMAILLVSAEGRLLQANAAAQTLLAHGRLVTARQDIVRFEDASANDVLRTSLAASAPQPMLTPVGGGGAAGPLTAAIFVPDNDRRTRAIVLHELLPNSPAHGKHLVDVFGFTPREIAVLMPLLQGASVQEISDQLGVGLPTVRTHVARLLEKTGSARQSDLVQKVLRAMPPVLMG